MQEYEAQRRELYGLLGDLPERDRPVGGRSLGVEERPGYTLERLVLDLNESEAVPAYFIRPHGATGPLPTVLYHHAHGGDFILGKDEVINGRVHLQPQSYAEALTARGYAVLALDAWGFGERRGRTESELFKAMLWRGQVLWGMMVYDNLRSIDYLATRPDVDLSRLATLGLSMGSTMAWWLAALDERVKVCVDLCCLTDFQALIEMQLLDRHGLYYYVPSLLKHFDTAGINALIAPRPHLGSRRDLRSADARCGARPDRSGAERGIPGARRGGRLGIAAFRDRAFRDGGDARGGPRLARTLALSDYRIAGPLVLSAHQKGRIRAYEGGDDDYELTATRVHRCGRDGAADGAQPAPCRISAHFLHPARCRRRSVARGGRGARR